MVLSRAYNRYVRYIARQQRRQDNIMGFIITKDNVASDEDKATYTEPCNLNAKGLTGPSSILPDTEARLRRGEGEKFRMRYDEPLTEEKPAYYGLWIEDDREGEFDQFQALDCFGTPNAGCAWIEFKNSDGIWEVL